MNGRSQLEGVHHCSDETGCGMRGVEPPIQVGKSGTAVLVHCLAEINAHVGCWLNIAVGCSVWVIVLEVELHWDAIGRTLNSTESICPSIKQMSIYV